MESIKQCLLKNGWGCCMGGMKQGTYQTIVDRINETFNKNYTLSSIIPDDEIEEVL